MSTELLVSSHPPPARRSVPLARTPPPLVHLQWGTLDFHKRSLRNLNEAMRKTRKLCAVMLDTVGREITVKREVQIDEMGWPVHDAGMTVSADQKVGFVAVGVLWACLIKPPQAAGGLNMSWQSGAACARAPLIPLRCPQGRWVSRPPFVLDAAVRSYSRLQAVLCPCQEVQVLRVHCSSVRASTGQGLQEPGLPARCRGCTEDAASRKQSLFPMHSLLTGRGSCQRTTPVCLTADPMAPSNGADPSDGADTHKGCCQTVCPCF